MACFANFATFKKIKSLKMNYDQLIRHISELGGGDQELGSIRFFSTTWNIASRTHL